MVCSAWDAALEYNKWDSMLDDVYRAIQGAAVSAGRV